MDQSDETTTMTVRLTRAELSAIDGRRPSGQSMSSFARQTILAALSLAPSPPKPQGFAAMAPEARRAAAEASHRRRRENERKANG